MLISVLLLLSLGIAVIFTSSPELALQQVFFAFLGLVGFFILKNFDFRALKSLIWPAYVIILFLLVITLFLGLESRGSVRWIPIGPFNFQPSEFAKPVLILMLANFWANNQPNWRNIFKSFLIFLPLAALIFRQPDLGTMLTVLFIWIIMLVASNVTLVKMGILSFVGILVIPLIWLGLKNYQKQRIFTFLSPNSDPQGVGFHVIQSQIAIGSGQFFGRGLGRGTQSRLQFLPEFRTDFIFAFIAEELGFIGSFMVMVLYGIMFFFLFKILSVTKDRFGELIIIGVIGMLFFQMTVNIGMNIGVLPVTGITLPFLSYGGSSIVTNLISIGLVASISKFGLKKETEAFRFGLT